MSLIGWVQTWNQSCESPIYYVIYLQFIYPTDYQWYVTNASCVYEVITRSGIGVTEALSAILCVSDFSDSAKVTVRSFESHSYLTCVTSAKLWWPPSNMNMIFNEWPLFDNSEKFAKMNELQEIGFVNPSPDLVYNDLGFVSLCYQCWYRYNISPVLTHCGLVMSYGNRDLGQHWHE